MLSSTVSCKLVCWPEGISNNTDPSGGKLNAIIVFQLTSNLFGLFKGFHILLVEIRAKNTQNLEFPVKGEKITRDHSDNYLPRKNIASENIESTSCRKSCMRFIPL